MTKLRSLSEPQLGDTCAAIVFLLIEVAVLLVGVTFFPACPSVAVPAGILLVVLAGMRINALGVIVHEGFTWICWPQSQAQTIGFAIGERRFGRSTRGRSTDQTHPPPPVSHHRFLWRGSVIQIGRSIWYRRAGRTGQSHVAGSGQGNGVQESGGSTVGYDD